ncbi:putative tetratricopeptide repeat protein 41 [Pseudophryne corroboree]|uniref:putative tetratricopeptide repeat protein 41 n=1 Tax=Pseudophryne corroboree TaxID=495146 RepID=UPI0030816218
MAQLAEHSLTSHKDHHYYFTSRSPICPYVCSTPKDFVAERNYLAQTIFPQLVHFCLTRGTYFKAVDLKWPIIKSSSNEHSISHVQTDYIAHQQLKLCLDYINSSFPFFICILGHTYGEFLPKMQVPMSSACLSNTSGLSEIEQNLIVAERGGYPWVLEGRNKECSFTELEVIQATSFKDAQFQYYYFRDYQYIEEQLLQSNEYEKQSIMSSFASANENEELKIWELKTSIVDKGFPVRFFKTKEELGSLVLKDWCDVIDKLYPLNSTPANIGHEHNLAQAYHQAYVESLCKDFVDSQRLKKLFLVLDTFASDILINEPPGNISGNVTADRSDVKSILLLHGERGSGKSTAVAKWLTSYRRCYPDVTVIPYFVGNSGRRDNIMCFMQHCIILLQCDYFGIETNDVYSNENFSDMWEFPLLVEAFLASVALKPCVLVLDGVDELSGTHGQHAQQAKRFAWLSPKLPHQCKMIMTTRTFHLSHKCLMLRSDVQMAEFGAITDVDERLCIFYKHLAMPSRNVAQTLLESITNKKKKITALHLAVLASELRICPNLSSCRDSHLEPVSTEQLWSLLIHHWIKHYSWSCEWKKKGKKSKPNFASDVLNTGWVVDVLCVLTTSHCGLHDGDILKLLNRIGYQHQYEVTPLHWAAFRSATSKWIWEKPDGLLQIRYQSFRDAVAHLLLGVAMPISECLEYSSQVTMNHKRTYFHHLLLKHFQQMDLSHQVYEEVPWHLKMTGKLKELYRFLLNPRTLSLICRNMKYGCQMKMDLIQYWQTLLYSGKDPAVECEMLLHRITEHPDELADQGRVMSFAAQCLKEIGKTKEALAILSSIECLLTSSEGINNKVLLWSQKIAGDLYRDIGSWQEAILCYNNALDNLHCFTADDLENNCKLLKLRERLLCLKATLNTRRCFEQRSQMLENTIEQFHLYTHGPYEQAAVKLCKGLQRFSVGDLIESEKYLDECLDIRSKLYGKNHILCGEVQEYIADIQSHPQTSNYSQRLHALEYYKSVIKIKEDTEKYSSSPEIRQNLRLSLSNTLLKAGKLLCHSDLGNSKEAVEMLQRSLDIRTSIVGLEHPLSCEVQFSLKAFKNSRSKVLVLSGVENQPRNTSAIAHRRFFNVHPTVCHLDTEFLRKSPEALHSLIDNGTDDFVLRHSNRRAHSAHTILLKNSKLKYNEEEEYAWHQDTNSETALMCPISKCIGKRPASGISFLPSTLYSRPGSVCQTSMSGPLSDILSLVYLSRPVSKSECFKLVHKSAWYHVPGRYPTPQTPFPPKRHQVRKEIELGWKNIMK